jgi:hemoglobin
LEAGRAKQKLFFEQWLGGEPRYTQRYGSPRLRQRHATFAINHRRAERWLGHMNAAMHECGVDEGIADEILGALRPLARHFINQPASASAGQPEHDAAN